MSVSSCISFPVTGDELFSLFMRCHDNLRKGNTSSLLAVLLSTESSLQAVLLSTERGIQAVLLSTERGIQAVLLSTERSLLTVLHMNGEYIGTPKSNAENQDTLCNRSTLLKPHLSGQVSKVSGFYCRHMF